MVLRFLATAFLIDVVVLSIAGCDAQRRPDTISVAEPNASQAEGEWREQLAAVREGRSADIRISDVEVTSSEFRQLEQGCESLTTLVIDRGEIDDAALEVLAGLPKLHWLKVPGPVGDAGVEAISRCHQLQILNLPDGVFTDRSCVQIVQLDRLMLLRFGSPQVTDAGIQDLARLPRLRFLHLLDVPITDAGLESVASIQTLESFYLDGGQATEDGLRRLLAARPDLHVHLDQTHIPGDPNAHD